MKSAYAIAVLSILGGLLVHLMVLLTIRIEGPRLPSSPEDLHQVQFIGNLAKDAAPSIIEQAALNDSAPLFMPTKWNLVSDVANVASLQSATEIFEPYSPRLALVETRPTLPLQDSTALEPLTVRLPQGSAFILSRYGRKQPEIPDFTSAGASYSVSRLDRPLLNLLAEQVLPGRLHENAPQALWNPVQLFLHLDGGFPAGPPLVVKSSGFVNWDTLLQGYFAELSFYHQLNDGYYQIWVYP